jgi:hypothetical protein
MLSIEMHAKVCLYQQAVEAYTGKKNSLFISNWIV